MTLSLSVADDRLGQYFRKTLAIADRLDKSLPFEQVMAALQRIHDGEFETGSAAYTPKPKKEKLKVLAPRSVVTIGPLDKEFDPKEFFQTRRGLYVWDSFSSRILSRATATKSAAGVSLASADLTRNAYDREIKAELKEGHEVELWHIAKLIEEQKNGGEGPLLNNGCSNVFYWQGFVVGVFWDAVGRVWLVLDWELDDGRWLAGDRVFSYN